MLDGPYGEWSSRKNLVASCDQSLRRRGLDYVDIFYSHRFDPVTPLEETVGALASMVAVGKALYVGISNYPAAQTARAQSILKGLGVPCILHQSSCSMLNREIAGRNHRGMPHGGNGHDRVFSTRAGHSLRKVQCGEYAGRAR